MKFNPPIPSTQGAQSRRSANGMDDSRAGLSPPQYHTILSFKISQHTQRARQPQCIHSSQTNAIHLSPKAYVSPSQPTVQTPNKRPTGHNPNISIPHRPARRAFIPKPTIPRFTFPRKRAICLNRKTAGGVDGSRSGSSCPSISTRERGSTSSRGHHLTC
jgi:hypothetical protein